MSAIHWLEFHWLELGAGVLLVAFIVFAFRQGKKVRPLPSDEQPADSGRLRTAIPTHRGQRSGDCGQFLMSV